MNRCLSVLIGLTKSIQLTKYATDRIAINFQQTLPKWEQEFVYSFQIAQRSCKRNFSMFLDGINAERLIRQNSIDNHKTAGNVMTNPILYSITFACSISSCMQSFNPSQQMAALLHMKSESPPELKVAWQVFVWGYKPVGTTCNW
jgi:hypothetical protein